MARRSPSSSLTSPTCSAGSVPPHRVGVVRAGALGDFLLGVPALRALRQHLPDSLVTLAGPMPQARLAPGWGVADAVLDSGDLALVPLFDDHATVDVLPESLCALDTAVVWLRRHEVASMQLRLAGARQVVAALPFPSCAVHVADWLGETLGPLGVALPGGWDTMPWLSVPPGGDEWAARWRRTGPGARPYLVAHPGSGSGRKNWRTAAWQTVVQDVVRGRHVEVVITAGNADHAAAADLAKALRCASAAGPPTQLSNLSLEQLSGVLAGARLYLGNDSGVTHLAAGLGVPTVAVFGPTNPLVWRPRGPAVRVLGGNISAGIGDTPLIAADAHWPDAGAVAAAAVGLLAG